jgi:hypothetical protein
MKMRRILAGSIATLLLAMSALAASCDLSCAFSRADADCHARDAKLQQLPDSGRAMDGMDMAGMSMPEMAAREGQPATCEISRSRAPHPSIGDMGPCERQSCGQITLVSANAIRSQAPRLRAIAVIAPPPSAIVTARRIHNARDDVASDRPPNESSPPMNLRI